MKVLPETFVSASAIMDLLPDTYRNHTNITSLGTYLKQMWMDGEIDAAVVYSKNGNPTRNHVYRRKVSE